MGFGIIGIPERNAASFWHSLGQGRSTDSEYCSKVAHHGHSHSHSHHWHTHGSHSCHTCCKASPTQALPSFVALPPDAMGAHGIPPASHKKRERERAREGGREGGRERERARERERERGREREIEGHYVDRVCVCVATRCTPSQKESLPGSSRSMR